jgi:CBS domain-containing protein
MGEGWGQKEGRLMPALSRADRFLKAFNQIERELHRRVQADKFESFASSVKKAASSDGAVRRFRVDLLEYAELRNAIVHDGLGDDLPIADPHPETVSRIEHIYDLLSSPPTVIPEFQLGVEVTMPDERIGIPAGRMLAGDFSQLPVVADGKIIGLLTAETIARWLADHLKDEDLGLVEEATVNAVLDYTEDPENHTLFGRSASIFDALRAFDDYFARGKSLDAILITHNGTDTESLLGIITIYDVPRLRVLAS